MGRTNHIIFMSTLKPYHPERIRIEERRKMRNGDEPFTGFEVEGCWIETKCRVCESPLAYWSLTGKPLEKYADPKCDKHSKIVSQKQKIS